MSEKLCTLRTQGGGGGKQTETVLWTNSSPSSNFASQTITLSDNMTNYDYLKVTYINATGSSVSNIDIVPVSAFITTGTQTIRSALGAVGTTGGSTRDFARNYKYAADNQINFGTACALNYAAAENNRIIPTSIIGIKNMGGKEQGSDWATISVASTGTSNVCTGYAVASNSNKFTASYTNGSASGTITVLEEGLYDYVCTAQRRGTGTSSVSIGSQSYTTSTGEIYISANTVCTASVGGTAGSLGLACITLVKKS